MSRFSNYSFSGIAPNLNFYQESYNSDFIHQNTKINKISSNNNYSNYSLFNNDIEPNIDYYNLKNDSIKPLSYNYNKEKKYLSKSSEPDLDMMKIELRCDLIGQKINQIQNQVENFHESTSREYKNILKKNRTYGDINKNKNLYNKIENRGYIMHKFEKNNCYKNPIPIKKENELSDGFRKRKNINKAKSHNISYVDKSSNIYHLMNDSNKNTNNIYNFRQAFFVNTKNNPNQTQPIIENKKEKKYDKIIINKINSNPNITRTKDNKIIQINNYINDYNSKTKYSPNSYKRIQKNKKNKVQIIKRNHSAQRYISNYLSQNKKNINLKERKLSGFKNNINNTTTIFENESNSVANYGNFDKYFFNNNNFEDNSYIKYIDIIKNNFNSISYNNLDKIKQHSFSNYKIIKTNQIKNNNFIIQKGNNFNIINNQKINNQQNTNNKLNNIDNKFQIMNNYNLSFNNDKVINSINNKNNKNKSKKYNKNNIKVNKKIKTHINNNFNVNNNTNYFNFNYNQNNNHMEKNKNMKYNHSKNIKSKNNNSKFKKNVSNEKIKNYKEENSTNVYFKFNHDYSNDDLINISDMPNSTNDDLINFEYVKNPNIETERLYKTNMNTKQIFSKINS